jgi:hypothetical protein
LSRRRRACNIADIARQSESKTCHAGHGHAEKIKEDLQQIDAN